MVTLEKSTENARQARENAHNAKTEQFVREFSIRGIDARALVRNDPDGLYSALAAKRRKADNIREILALL